MRDHLDAIDAFRPDVYGLSFKTPMARLGYRTLRAVKERFPSMPVIAGGSHVSIMADEVMAMTPVDACFEGECEDTIVRVGGVLLLGRAAPGRDSGSRPPGRAGCFAAIRRRRSAATWTRSPGPPGRWWIRTDSRECRTASAGPTWASSSAAAVRSRAPSAPSPSGKSSAGRRSERAPPGTSWRRFDTSMTAAFVSCACSARSSTRARRGRSNSCSGSPRSATETCSSTSTSAAT